MSGFIAVLYGVDACVFFLFAALDGRYRRYRHQAGIAAASAFCNTAAGEPAPNESAS